MSTCRVCPARILWARSEATDAPMPIDAEPVEHGTILLQHVEVGRAPVAHVTTKDERDELLRQHRYRVEHLGHDDEPLRLYVDHHATCPAVERVRAGELQGQERLW